MEEFGGIALAAERGGDIDGLDDEVVWFIGILFEMDGGELVLLAIAALVGEDVVAFPKIGYLEREVFLIFKVIVTPFFFDEGFAFEVGGILIVISFELVGVNLVDDLTWGCGTVVEVFTGVIGFEDVFTGDEGFEDVLGFVFDGGLVCGVLSGKFKTAGDVVHRIEVQFMSVSCPVDHDGAKFITGFG